MIQLHNTLTRKLDTFSPIEQGKVRLYTCGPTVYDFLTVGNWVAYIRWDTLVRVLKANDYEVTRVMNITDVGHLVSDEDEGEDKLQKGARRENKTAWEIAEFYTKDFIKGAEKLNLIPPTHLTPATRYIPEQLELIRLLKQKSVTYQISDGIYFDTSKFPSYATFAHLDLDAIRAGARVEYNPEKRHPSDFALWKFSPEDEQRDMEWDTPADLTEEGKTRKGFPGWHLECSAMAMTLLGDTLDIHTGGIDHIPVHHTNEIAQSEAATGKVFSHYWLHNNHLKVNGTKISKSLGNGYTLESLKDKGYSPLDYRMFVLQSHYRTESNFTWENLTGAKNRLKHWRDVACLRWQTRDTLIDGDTHAHDQYRVELMGATQAIKDSLNNDLDTPEALRIIDDIFSEIEKNPPTDLHTDVLRELLETIDDLLGLKLIDSTPDIEHAAKQLIAERDAARANKDWKTSDEIRDRLAVMNIAVSDSPHGTLWSYAS